MKLRRLPIVLGAAVVLCLLLPGAVLAAPYWPAFPQSPETRSEQELFWIVVGIAFVFLVVVEGLIVFITIRFRARPGDPAEPPQVYVNHRLEFWWTAVPVAILVVIFGLTVRGINRETHIPSDALPITIIGHQWWWELRYPSMQATAVNEIHVPIGRTVRLSLQSADVVHNFWVPQLAGKEQLIPGMTNIWSFTTERAGIYEGACSEFCGGPHAWMRLTVVAEPAADFERWIALQKQPAAVPLSADRQVETVWNDSACAQCHTIRGSNASGAVGPDLTHVGSRLTLAAGRFANDEGNMTAWLHNAQAVKPGSYMPDLRLSTSQANTLAKYLEQLK